MPTSSLFRQLPHAARGEPSVTLELDGAPLTVPAGITVAAALMVAGVKHFRTTPVGNAPRSPYCMMGVCFECLIEIDGEPNRQACLVAVREGMRLRTQHRARALPAVAPENDHAR